MQMISTLLLQEFSQLLLKHGASIEDIIGMVYTEEELDPSTGKYKKYFELGTIKRNPKKYPDGFSYKIYYRMDFSGQKIEKGTATFTTKTSSINEAVKLGFDNRLLIIKKYEANKGKPKGGKKLYQMLDSYYKEDSEYLNDDRVNNKREVVYKQRKIAQTFIEMDLIPYLTENKIRNIEEITTPIYSGLKKHLQEKGIKDKTINNRLSYFTRIMEYHLRNGFITKLPYTKSTAFLKLTGKQEVDDAEILPIEKLKGIYPHKNLIDPIALIKFIHPIAPTKDFSKLSTKEQKIIFDFYILPFTLGIIGLNTGMRNSEVARIKREDFIGVPEKNTFLLRAWNNKTDYFNKTTESKYRKIPLHSYTIETIKFFIKRKEELYGTINATDYVFGIPSANKDTGEIDGFLHYRVFDKAVILILKLIKHKENFHDYFSTLDELITVIKDIITLQEDVKELKEAGKGISYYSFRKTFRTMLGLKNDLAEYYMGHKLGDKSKTTYLQVNSLDNALFVDEYAEPVISMLDKYVFFSEEELKKMDEKDKNLLMDKADFFSEEN